MSSAPIIEVRGPWLRNNGDALGLWAVVEQFAGRATIAVSNTLGLDSLPPEPRLATVRWPPSRATLASAVRSPASLARAAKDAAVATLAPRRMLQARRLVRGSDLSALLDCSGFAYGDAWPIWRTLSRETYYGKLARRGVAIVLLPQAFGPFERPEVRDVCHRLLQHARLIFARDRVSVSHLETLGLGDRVAGPSPDITQLVPARAVADPAAWARRVCVVPNTRMVDRTHPARAAKYVDFLVRAVDRARAADLAPHLLVHEHFDLPLARRVQDSCGLAPPIVSEEALASKGILGSCFGVIGSRYHALVSALSQGVPAIGTSWSHKYEELFSDYGCPELLLAPEDDTARLDAAFSRFFDPAERETLAARLVPRAREMHRRVREMWGRVEAEIPALAAAGVDRGAAGRTARPAVGCG